MKFSGLALSALLSIAAAHTIHGAESIRKQLWKRDEIGLIEDMYENLPYPDIDFINNHLANLTAFNGTKCETCKNKIKYARTLIDEDPDNQHLISLTLFKYCLSVNKNDPTKCDTVDFFINTQSNIVEGAINDYDSGFGDDSAVHLFDNDFMHMVKNFNISSDLDLEYYCYFKNSKACPLPETPDVDSKFNFESRWPAKQPQHFSEPDYGVEVSSRELFNVLHLTDFHTQFRYTVGAEANCTSGICCLPESYNSDLPNMKNYNFTSQYFTFDPELENIDYSFYQDAYYDADGNYIKGENYDLVGGRGFDSAVLPGSTFGGYTCDAPVVLINNTMRQVQRMQKDLNFEFTLFTGDLVDHDKIHDSPEITKQAEVFGFQAMKEHLGNTPVYPALGNHDTFPYGQLAPLSLDPNSTYQYNSELMSDIWIGDGWLPESERQEIKDHYAGFSTTTNRGLKVIGLNSNAYYQKNLWGYINLSENYDPFGQWEFLINELVESEKTGQRVWILAHIPSGDGDVLPIQSKIFAKIVERFSPYTIANIFFGHTHRDQFKILYSANTSDAEIFEKEVVNMAWIAQSVTPAWSLNPAFRYYQVEDKSFNIRNSFSYFTQLNETFVNGGNEPVWKFGYSPRDTYDPEHTWPEESPINATFWNKYVVQPMFNKTNIEANQVYVNNQYRNSPLTPDCTNGTETSEDCYSDNLCNVANFLSEDYIKCDY